MSGHSVRDSVLEDSVGLGSFITSSAQARHKIDIIHGCKLATGCEFFIHVRAVHARCTSTGLYVLELLMIMRCSLEDPFGVGTVACAVNIFLLLLVLD